MTDFRNNNFDALRLIGAILVLWGHTFILTGGIPASILAMSVHTFGVKIFFVISGYLIAKSWQNDPHLLRYAQRRALRIFPALAGCVIFTALVIGPIFTTAPLGDYFSSHLFWAYFKNIGLHINYQLPGMFLSNPVANSVNGSLWTLPVELIAYIVCPILVIIGSWGKLGRILLFALAVVFVGLDLYGRTLSPQEHLPFIIYATDWIYAGQLWSYFLLGSVYALLKLERFVSLRLAVVLCVLYAILPLSGYKAFVPAFILIPYVTLAFALSPRIKQFDFIVLKGDYSYGLYLYAFPVQQIVTQTFGPIPVLAHFLISLQLTWILAYCSWRFIEAPALKFKPVHPKKRLAASNAKNSRSDGEADD